MPIGRDKHACVLTLVDQLSGFAVIKKLTARTVAQATQATATAIAQQAGKIRMITFDNGSEFHSYALRQPLAVRRSTAAA